MSGDPQIGLATTEDLYRELIARITTTLPYDMRGVERALALAEQLGGLSAVEREYRTVDAS